MSSFLLAMIRPSSDLRPTAGLRDGILSVLLPLPEFFSFLLVTTSTLAVSVSDPKFVEAA
jgi:hypothetical protein